jgi:hypothetical protein
MTQVVALSLLSIACLSAQPDSSPLKPLAFLEGTWGANTELGATSSGTYTFAKELAGHILARRSVSANCNGPAGFNCDHKDLLFIYPDGEALKAIYFDNEGHVIHYAVSTPSPTTVVFLSDRFRLVYERKDAVMSGKFQMRMPGQTEWKSYLEWSGPKKP